MQRIFIVFIYRIFNIILHSNSINVDTTYRYEQSTFKCNIFSHRINYYQSIMANSIVSKVYIINNERTFQVYLNLIREQLQYKIDIRMTTHQFAVYELIIDQTYLKTHEYLPYHFQNVQELFKFIEKGKNTILLKKGELTFTLDVVKILNKTRTICIPLNHKQLTPTEILQLEMNNSKKRITHLQKNQRKPEDCPPNWLIIAFLAVIAISFISCLVFVGTTYHLFSNKAVVNQQITTLVSKLNQLQNAIEKEKIKNHVLNHTLYQTWENYYQVRYNTIQKLFDIASLRLTAKENKLIEPLKKQLKQLHFMIKKEHDQKNTKIQLMNETDTKSDLKFGNETLK